MPKDINFCFTKFKSMSSPEPSTNNQENYSRPFCASRLIKNFNSIYDLTMDCAATTTSCAASDHHHHHHAESESEADEVNAPDFATAFASNRFFFSSPGRSNSIIDSSSVSSSLASTSSSSPGNPPETETLVGGSVAVPTYSPDPYMDFRRSMQEMVEARELYDVRANWDYLHELLMCYISLNPKSTHKFIVGAFADLLVSLMTSSPPLENSGRITEFSGEISRQCM